VAVSLAGSVALGEDDEYSDVDLQAFTKGEFPSVEQRRRVYQDTPGVELGPLDHPIAGYLDTPPFSANYVVDWVYIDGTKCDVAWFTQEGVEKVLAALSANPSFPNQLECSSSDSAGV